MPRRPRVLTTAAAVGLVVLSLSGCGLLGQSVSAEIGECMDYAALEEQMNGAAEGEITELPTLECSTAHNAEVVHTFEVPEGDWPGMSAIDDAISANCLPAFESYVGEPFAEAENFDMFLLTPTEQSWGQGDREVICIAYTLDGSTTTTSFKGSAG